MLVTNIKLENFSCGSVCFIGNRFTIELPANSTGDSAVFSNIPSDVLDETLATMAVKAPYVAVTIIDEEDNRIPWPPIPRYMPYRKDNYAGSVAPGVNDDETQGYSVGSVWAVVSSPPEFYRCADGSAGAAVWLNTTLEIGELGTAALSDAGDFEPAGAVGAAMGTLGTAALEDVAAFDPAGAAQAAVDGHKDDTTGVHGAGTGTVAIVDESGYLLGKPKLAQNPPQV